MEYRYLKGWIKDSDNIRGFRFQGLSVFEDQYIITFKKRKEILQIDLSKGSVFYSRIKTPFTTENGFCNYCNDHLKNSTLNDINILDKDRIIVLVFTRVNIYNQQEKFRLILELIPRYYNIILVNDSDQDGLISDSLKRISFAENTTRQVLPGIVYQPPSSNFEITDIDVQFPIIFNYNSFETINDFLEHQYFNVILENRINGERSRILKTLRKKLKSKEKKLEKLKLELEDSLNETVYYQKAELLKASFHNVKKGMKEVELQNYFAEDYPIITIELNVEKSPQQNVEWYFKKYRKAKSGKLRIQEEIEKTDTDIDEINREIFDIEEQNDYVELKSYTQKSDNKVSKKKKSYRKLFIDDCWEIFIGRTNRENDELTTRFAKPYDWWFHSRIFRGSHIIIRNYKKKAELPDDLRDLSARIAAYYSKAKKSENVPVDYTQIRHVRKPRGSAAGFVTYKNQKTLYVNPLSMRDAAGIIEKMTKG